MKTTLIILLFIFVSVSLLADEISLIEKNIGNYKIDKFIAVSLLILPRVCIGIIKTKQFNEKLMVESTFYFHVFIKGTYKHFGIGVQGTQFFRKNRRDGFYMHINTGFEYLEHDDFSFIIVGYNDDNDDIEKSFLPNISVGSGYSFRVSRESYLRLNMDIGMKLLISNIYLSFVW
ncbi:MAG: hypothetical protein KAS53_00335 [Candidatus Cloacimonetes bacterium]|nr:hypothetical protein [Candidatus Cloacimonadota bacterium]